MQFNRLSEQESAMVQQYLLSDPAGLALKLHGKKGIDRGRIIQQIVSRRKAKAKLPDWYAHPELFFPAPVSVEQASSQATALYKASLATGNHLADLTLGMGVDSFYFSKRFREISGYETNSELAAVTAYNLTVLGASNIRVFTREAPPVTTLDADWIYIDPSRRDSLKRKTVAFENSSPNVLALLPELMSSGAKTIIKSSPLIDIDLAVKQLRHVTEVHVTGYQNECKELIFVLDPANSGHFPQVCPVLIDDTGNPIHKLVFNRQHEASARPVCSDPSKFLYEPHPAFMKSGGFGLLSEKYEVTKIAPNSHLYTSEYLRTDFPGRLFKITDVVSASAFSWKRWLKEGKANLTLRNFPSTQDDLRKKWRLKEGGEDYLFATTLVSGKRVVIITRKV